jgi:hypothetical protein
MSDPDSIVDTADPRTNFLRGMGGNLLWYIPLFAWVIWYFAIPNATSGYRNVRLVFQHWTWGLLLSPSAYLFFATVLYSVVMPLHFMLFIPGFFARDATYNRRYLFSSLVLAALAVVAVITQIIIQSSFPFCWQSDGVERMRMLPFLPCPK